MLKLLFIVLISCTTIFALPHHHHHRKHSSEENGESEVIPKNLGSIQHSFGKSFSKIGDAITDSLKEVFQSIEDRLESTKFREAVQNLKKITDKIFNEKHELRGDERTKKIIDDQLDKVNVAFEIMLEKGIKFMKWPLFTVDATYFKFTVDRLAKLVDDLYSQH